MLVTIKLCTEHENMSSMSIFSSLYHTLLIQTAKTANVTFTRGCKQDLSFICNAIIILKHHKKI